MGDSLRSVTFSRNGGSIPEEAKAASAARSGPSSNTSSGIGPSNTEMAQSAQAGPCARQVPQSTRITSMH